MNQHGVLLTLMVFFVGIVVVALAISHSDLQKQQESALSFETAQYTVNDRFQQVYYGVPGLLQNKGISLERSRVLPFDYGIDSNQLWLHQEMPIPSSRLASYSNFLNLFAVFWQNKADINVGFSFKKLKDTNWGGSVAWPVYQYKLLPQCLLYKIDIANNSNGKRVLTLDKGTIANNGCEFDAQLIAGFPDYLKNGYKIQQIIVTIHANKSVNSPVCTNDFLSSPVGCWRKPLEPSKGFPFGKVVVQVGTDTNFSAYNHFNPLFANSVQFKFAGNNLFSAVSFGSVTNNIMTIDLTSDANTITSVDVNVQFRKPVEAFVLENFFVSASKPGFGIRQLSQLNPQLAYCGDFNCAGTETLSSCPQDCTCGNGKCEAWENPFTCFLDCGITDKICSSGEVSLPGFGCCCSGGGGGGSNCAPTCDVNETIANCPSDCQTCGNGSCDSGECTFGPPKNTCSFGDSNCEADCCQNQCPFAGAQECAGSDPTHQYHVCTNTDLDPCLEWGPIQTCNQFFTCINGSCQIPP